MMPRTWRASPAGPFGSDELRRPDGSLPPPEELNEELAIARALEDLGRGESAASFGSPAFVDRVMATVSEEPAPAPVRLAGSAVRRRSLAAFAAALVDAWRVTFGAAAGRPLAVRAPAFALVLLVAVLGGGAGLGSAAALGLLDGPAPSPTAPVVGPTSAPTPSALPSPSPTPSIAPTPSPTPTPTLTPSPTPTPTPSPRATDNRTASPTATDDDATETPEATSDDGSDDSGPGSGSGSSGSGSGSGGDD